MKRDMHSRCDFAVIGEASVYPGHPVTVAYLITQVFDDYNEACKKGHNYPNALEANAIPGAGGNVYIALDLLSSLRDGKKPWSKIMSEATDYWRRLGKSDNRSRKDVSAGQKQASRIKPLLKTMESWWKR